MPLIYAVVARGNCVLAEYTPFSGNYGTITRTMLGKIGPNDSKMSYTYDRYLFHYVVSQTITFVCMADEAFGRRVPFAFLEDIKNRWFTTYGDKGRTATAHEMNHEFSKIIQKQMDFYSNDPNADKMTRVQKDIDDVKTIMVSNIDKVLDRGEKIDILVDKTSNLNQNAIRFKKSSTELKNAMWWKNCKMIIILTVILLLVLYFIISMFCGGPAWPDCVGKDEKNSTK